MTSASFIQPSNNCHQCTAYVEANAKFCGECGAHTYKSKNLPELKSYKNRPFMGNHFETTHAAAGVERRTPGFAAISPKQVAQIPQELKDELGNTIMLLIRERLFLCLHYLIFLCVNLFGLILAIKAYCEYAADELTRIIVAMAPLLFINAIGLVCLVPIKGTKREISKLKEKLNYMRFQIELGNVI